MLSDLTTQAQDAMRVNRFTDAIPTTKDEILLSPSGKLLAVPWYEYQALYRIDEQVTLMSTFGTGNDVLCAFSRDESRLFSYDAFESRRVLAWDLTSTPPVSTPIELDCERTNGIRAVDGSDWLLMNASVEGREVYHLLDATCQARARIRVDRYFWQAEDFAAIAIGESDSRILIAVTGARADIGGEFASIGRPQCVQLLAYDIDTDELQLIEREIEMNSYVRDMGFRSDGRELIAITDQTIYRLYLDSEGHVEDISTASNGADPPSMYGQVGVDVIDSAIIPNNGSIILHRSPDYEFRWLNAEREYGNRRHPSAPLIYLQTSDDGSVRVGATWTEEPRVHVWTSRGQIVGEDDIGTVRRIAFSPSGSRFALEGEYGVILGTINDGFPAIVERIGDVRSIHFLEEATIQYSGTHTTRDGTQLEVIERDFSKGSQEHVLRPGGVPTVEAPFDPTDGSSKVICDTAGYDQNGLASLVYYRDQDESPWAVEFMDSNSTPVEIVPLESPLEDFWIDAFIATNVDGSRTSVCMSARELIEIRRGDSTEVVRHPIDYTIDAMAYSPQGWLMTVDRQGYVRIRE